MSAKESGKLVGGSIAVYVIMAACSAGSGSPGSAARRDGGASSSGSGGGSASGGGSDGSGSGELGDGASIFDAISDPVPEAMAAPPIVAMENCDKQYSVGVTLYYAEHPFPGYTANQLAFVVALIQGPGVGSIGAIPNYSQSQAPAAVRDGFVATTCPSGSVVTFILPQ